MKAILLSIALLLTNGMTPGTEAARQPQSVTVKINNKTTVPKTGMTIAFTELVEDSRCPTDTTCVWAGNAKIKIRVTKNGRSEDLEMNTMRTKDPVIFNGYTLTLTKLIPEPRTNIRINRNGYEATIEVSKVAK